MKTSYREFTIILPTFNEGQTIGKMLSYVLANYKGAKIIVADDGSTDDTKRIVRKFAERSREVTFFDRSAKGLRRGLTASVADAILLSRTKFAIVMDADMQHPPNKVKDVANRLEEGNDLVVATRARVTNWALYRRIISKALIYKGKAVLAIQGKETCADIFSGFFGVKRSVFVNVFNKNKRRFVREGYKVLFDFLKCVNRGKIGIAEVPFVFRIRKFGSSKAGIKQAMALFKSFVT